MNPDEHAAFLREFGRRVKARREALGLTQADLARALHMWAGQWHRIEEGQQSRLHVWQLWRLAQLFGTTIDALVPQQDGACRTQEDVPVLEGHRQDGTPEKDG